MESHQVKSWTDKKYLVTGGTGFIGSALVHVMVNRGLQVRIFDNDYRGSRDRLREIEDQIEWAFGDIRDPQKVKEVTAGIDCVIHLAYINGTEHFYTIPEVILEVAVKGMMNILDACKDHGIKELFLASSSEVYQSPPVIPTDETAPLCVPDVLNPRYSYGGGKIISELLTVNYGRRYFDRAVIFRPHNVYGPDMGNEHVIPQLIRRMKKIETSVSGPVSFPIQGSGEETRAFIYVQDFVDALLLLLETGGHMEIYHVGVSEEVKIRDLVGIVGAALGLSPVIQPGSLKAGSTLRRCPDTSKLNRLGFRPKFTLAQGIQETVNWYIQH